MTPRTTLIGNGRPQKTASTPSSPWWSSPRRRRPRTSLRRRLRLESLETRQLLDGAPWQNPVNRFDVDGDHLVMPADVLAMVNDINARQSRELPAPSTQAGPPPYLDVNGDNWITPADVLDCINFINYLWQEGIPPIVTVGTLLTSNAQPTLSGTVTDPWPTRGISGVKVTVAAQTLAATISGSTWSAAVPLPLADGVYDVTAQATDWAGNVGSDATSNELVVDTEIPTVTVNQAAGQLDPSQTSPVYFKVVFSEAVFGFEAEDVTLTGTAPGAPGATVTPVGSDGTTYTVAVGGMIGSGTVVAGIPAGAAHDAAGNGNAASTSTDNVVTCNFPPLFEDEELEQAVRQALGLPAGEYVDRDDVLAVTALQVDSNVVESLDGLQYLTNLQSFAAQPGDWTAPAGELSGADPLAPLAGLSKLETLTLQRVALAAGELASLAGLSGVRTLDLRYNAIETVPDLNGLTALASLHLHGNPVVETSSLAGRVLQTDLAPGDVNQAGTVAELAAALHHLPLAIYEHVVNQFEYQPYPGSMKGPQAVLETGAGNDWDQAALLVALLDESGVAARYASGRIDVEIPVVLDWLGVTGVDAAGAVLANAGLNPVLFYDAFDKPIFYRFDHTWVEAWLNVPGQGTQWVALDASWKFRDFQPGVPEILANMPFDETDYLSQVRAETAAEYYAQAVGEYLAANFGDVSLADVSYDGPILPQVIDTPPSGLPYDVHGTPNIWTDIPLSMTHRVRVVVQQSGADLIDQLLVLPEMGLQRVTIDFAGDGDPLLRLDGDLLARGDALFSGGDVEIYLYHYDPGDDDWDNGSGYVRSIGDYIAVGLDANQISQAMLQRQWETVNEANIAALNGQAVAAEDQIGALLALGILGYFYDTNAGEELVDGLTHAVPVYARVASGLATSETAVTLHPDLMIPSVPRGVNVDVINGYHQSFSIDGDAAAEAARERIIDLDGSAQEHAIWERLVNTESISTIKSLQLAGDRGIPVFEIDDSNDHIYLPQLNLSAFTEASIQAEISAGSTVTVPRDPTPLNDWHGVGYIVDRADGSNGFIISGGLFVQAAAEFQGGSGTGEPDAPPPNPDGNPDENQSEAGDPVNVANGNVTRDESDIQIPGIGLPLRFDRHYDSQSDLDVGLGIGWLHSYSHFLATEPDGTVIWTTDRSHRLTFAPDGLGGYVTPATRYGVLTKTAGGYRYREKNGMIYDFDDAGKLVEIRDRNHNSLTLSYDGGGLLTAVIDTDAPARRLSFTYSGDHVTAVADFTGRTWSYAYTGDHLTQVTSPSDAETPAAIVQYAYYPDTDAARGGLLQQIGEPDGGRRTYEYYANRRARQVTDPQGFAETLLYDLFRQRTAYLDQGGHATFYDYDDRGQVTHMIHPDGARESFVWHDGLMTSWTDPLGNTETYHYDTLGNLTRLTDRAGVAAVYAYEPTYSQMTQADGPEGRTTGFAYDANGNLTSITDALGNVTTMTYDARGLLLARTRPKGSLTSDPDDYTTAYTYNPAGQVLTATTDLPTTISYTYDPVGNRVSQTDADGNTTQYRHDVLDRLIEITDPLNHAQTMQYDALGRLVALTDALGQTRRQVYDFNGNLLRAIRPDATFASAAYDPIGRLVWQADELGRRTQTVYDPRGRMIQRIDGEGAVLRTHYDGGGRVVAEFDALGNATHYAYDKLDRLLTVTDALGGTLVQSYDAVGNLVAITDRRGGVTVYEYDLLNRVTQIRGEGDYVLTADYDAQGNEVRTARYDVQDLGTVPADPRTLPADRMRVYETVHDVLDRPIERIGPLGHSTTTEYDSSGRVTRTTDERGEETVYEYDAAGNLIRRTNPDGGVVQFAYDEVYRRIGLTMPAGGLWQWEYDSRGRVIAEVDPLDRRTEFQHAAVDHLLAQNNPDGSWVRSVYDAVDRLVRRERSDGSFDEYTYDANGNVWRAENQDSRVTLTYDALGRRTSESTIIFGDSFAPSVQYAYDAESNLIQVADSWGVSIVYTYDLAGRLLSLTSSDGEAATLTYTGYGQRESITYGSGRVDTFAYDGGGWLDGIRFGGPGGASAIGYSRDAAGAPATITENLGGVSETLAITYDAMGRPIVVTAASHPARSESFAYDLDGNLAETGAVTGGAFDAADQLLSSSGGIYEYDSLGNLATTEGSDGSRLETQHDASSRIVGLAEYDSAGALVREVEFICDALGRRIKIGGAETTYRVFAFDNMIAVGQSDGGPATETRYLVGTALDDVFAARVAGQVRYLHRDEIGNVRLVSDAAGTVIAADSYSLYGRPVMSTGTNDTDLGFTARPADADTGLVDLRARLYDPALGRFDGRDPVSSLAAGMSLYAYANDSPLSFVDPSGQKPEKPGPDDKPDEPKPEKTYNTKPTLEDLLKDPKVTEAVDKAWDDSKPNAPDVPKGQPGSEKKEHGGGVYWNSKTGELKVESTGAGSRDGTNGAPAGTGDWEKVAEFHTHPNTAAEGYSADPSASDKNYVKNTSNVPEIIKTHDGIKTVPYP